MRYAGVVDVIPRYRLNPKRDPFKVLGAMAHVSWKVLGQCYTPDCCIAATRVGIEALKPFGIVGRPMAVKLMAMNEAYWQYVKGEAPLDPERARYLVIDETCDGPGYSGHLIIVGKVKGKQFILDLSVYQLNRPHKEIHIPPEGLFMLLPDEFEFKGAWSIPAGNPRGGVILYSAYPNAPDYTKTPDWYFRTPLHRETSERMRDELVIATRIALGEV